jgi:exonuclease III
VRGLNASGHRDVVRQLVVSERISLVCLQETKLQNISDYDVIQLVATDFDYVFLSAVQTRGGILVAWRTTSRVTSDMSSQSFSLSVRLHQVCGGLKWWLTSVYNLSRDEDKPLFLAELHDLRVV